MRRLIIQRDIQAIGTYVNTVYMMETSIPIIIARYEGQEVRDRIENLNRNRRLAHERAIMSVKRLNRFAEMEGLPLIFEGNIEDRYEIADFCMRTVEEVFYGRSGIEKSLFELQREGVQHWSCLDMEH